MLAQGNALGFGIHQLRRALKGRRVPLRPFRAEDDVTGTLPGALPRANYLRAVGATSWPCTQVEQLREESFMKWLHLKSQITSYRSCTSDSGEDGGVATGLSVCGPRQLSTTAICCTQETVQSGAQCFFVKYSRRRSSAVYFSSGMPG